MSKIVNYKFQITTIDFFGLLISSESFRNQIIQIFLESKFVNVFWEFPPYSTSTTQNMAEFAFVTTSNFDKANSSSFSEYLKGKKDGEIVMFKNPSGDTDLITINSSNTNNQTFCHIMEFMTNATYENKHNLLKKIGEEMIKHTNGKNAKNPIYLSTHGHGVPWLHVRICNKPKYYSSAYSRL